MVTQPRNGSWALRENFVVRKPHILCILREKPLQNAQDNTNILPLFHRFFAQSPLKSVISPNCVHAYIVCCTALAALSLYVISMPIIFKLLGALLLIAYVYKLLTNDPISQVIYLGTHHLQCHLHNGTVCFATLADDSIFLRWFVLLRFVVDNSQRSYSLLIFKHSAQWPLAQQIRCDHRSG